MIKYLKYPNQTILDFVLTHYGSIDNLFDFLSEANLTNSDDFYNDARFFKLPLIAQNDINSYFASNGIIVGSDNQSTYNTEFTYNNDLRFKSIILGDYSNDFNNDFDIEEGLTIITVGYQGMTLTVEFSINNIGNLKGTTIGTVTLDNGITPVVKNYVVDIYSNNTETITVEFEDLEYGVYTVRVQSSNPDIDVTETIGVLGKPQFDCNADLSISGTPAIGGTVEMVWSITNNGNSSGFYQGFSYYPNGGYEDYNVVITPGTTHSFTRLVDITETSSTFVSSCGQSLDIVVT